VKFSPVALEQYERWVGEQGKERRIITVMGRTLTAAQISAVASVCAQHSLNIDVITRLSGRVSLSSLPSFQSLRPTLRKRNLPDERLIRTN